MYKIKIFFSMIVATFRLCHKPSKLLLAFLAAKLGLNKFNLRVNFINLRSGTLFEESTGHLDPADLYSIWEIWHKRVYTTQGFEINPNDIVLDVGAHRGFFTIYAASKAYNGKVYAFEPVLKNYLTLERNLKINNLSNVDLEKLALGKAKAERDMYLSNRSSHGHGLFFSDFKNKEKVAVEKLEDYCNIHNINHINFMKLDCEGAEYEIIAGLTPDMASKIDKIAMEYHLNIPNHNPEQLLDKLKELGFQITQFDKEFIKARRIL